RRPVRPGPRPAPRAAVPRAGPRGPRGPRPRAGLRPRRRNSPMTAGAPVEVVAFDVNETLSDMAPLTVEFTAAGLPADLRTAWFASTLRDGFALAAAGTEALFADIAADALRTLLHGRPDLTRPADEVVESVLGAFGR